MIYALPRDPPRHLRLHRFICQNSTYVYQQPFVVIDNLSADILLGTIFMQTNVENIRIRRSQLILTDGITFSMKLRVPSDGNPDNVNYITLPQKPPPVTVCVAKAQCLEPHTAATTLAQIPKSATFLLEAYPKTYPTSQASIPYGIFTVVKNSPL